MSETVKEKEKTKWMEQNGGKGLEVIRRKGEENEIQKESVRRRDRNREKRNHEKGTGKHREVQSETMRN